MSATLELGWNANTNTAGLEAQAITQAQSLRTAVIISLGTDRLAATDDLLPVNNGDRRGYWGDIFTPGRNLGSRLWLLARAKATDDTLTSAVDYATEALQWLIDDQVAQAVTVTGAWQNATFLVLTIVITRQTPNGGSVNHSFDILWSVATGSLT